jgi:hypothetical protein
MFVLTGTTTGPVSIGAVTVKLRDHALQSAPSLTRTHSVSAPEPLWYVVCGSCDAETRRIPNDRTGTNTTIERHSRWSN